MGSAMYKRSFADADVGDYNRLGWMVEGKKGHRYPAPNRGLRAAKRDCIVSSTA